MFPHFSKWFKFRRKAIECWQKILKKCKQYNKNLHLYELTTVFWSLLLKYPFNPFPNLIYKISRKPFRWSHQIVINLCKKMYSIIYTCMNWQRHSPSIRRLFDMTPKPQLLEQVDQGSHGSQLQWFSNIVPLSSVVQEESQSCSLHFLDIMSVGLPLQFRPTKYGFFLVGKFIRK